MKQILINLNRIKAALLSGKSAAYWSMFYMGIGPFTRIIDRLFLKPLVKKSNEIPPVFIIVSNQRSGSTFTFQLLSRLIPCVYYSNLHSLIPYYASTKLHNSNGFGKNLKGFNNFYGHTAKLNDTNEGNGSLSHLLIGNPNKSELRERFLEMTSFMKGSSKMPLVFKNVTIYKEIERLQEAIPEIKFIYLKRDANQVVQSMLRAYRELGYFNAIPDSLMDIEDSISPLAFITRQFVETEKVILDSKQKVNPENWIEWSYEDLCNNCEDLLSDLLELHTGNNRLALRMDKLISPLKASRTRKVSEKEENLISEELQKLGYEGA